MNEAIYPGTFDPVTNGHLDLIERGSRLFSRLIVAVAKNIEKTPVFNAQERVEMLREQVTGRFANVEVEIFDGLIVEFARQRNVRYLLRGLRTITDFEYEFQMALTNRDLDHEIETVYVMPSLKYSYVSARLIRETVLLGADMSHLIPASVQVRLRERLRGREGNGGGP